MHERQDTDRCLNEHIVPAHCNAVDRKRLAKLSATAGSSLAGLTRE